MRQAAMLMVMLVSGCDEPKRPAENGDYTLRKLEPPTSYQREATRKAAEPAMTPEQVILTRIINGAISDGDMASLVVEAKKNQTITYAHLKKNADRYKGKIWGFRGTIAEIAEVDGKTKARISIDSYGNDVVWVEAPFETDFVQGKTVDVIGALAGNFSYTSQAGWNISIPAMVAARIAKPGTFAPKRRRSAEDE